MKRKKEKTSNGRKALQYRGTKCLNCGHPLDKSDVYCPYCSQLNSDKQISAKDFFAEFLSSILVYDSRFRSTITDLLFHPGRMTRNYVDGQRMKYANPFRFYLSVSIIYFLISGSLSFMSNDNEDLSKEIAKAKAETKIGGLKIKNTSKGDTNFKLEVSEIETESNSNSKKKAFYVTEKDLDTMPWLNNKARRLDVYSTFYNSTEIQNSKQALDSLNHENTAINRWIYQKAITLEKIEKDPTTFSKYLLSKTPFFFFFFTPFYALFFLLIYPRKQFSYLAHVIFIFHTFSFLFLLSLIFIIPAHLFNIENVIGNIFFLILLIYFYKALRNFYGQNRFKTILKFVFLSIVFFISAIFTGLLFYSVTAAVY